MASLASARRSSASISSASCVGLVIVAEQMQEAMDDEMRDMVLQRLAFQFRLARHRLGGQHDVAEHRRQRSAGFDRKGRKGQDVGRLVLAAPVAR